MLAPVGGRRHSGELIAVFTLKRKRHRAKSSLTGLPGRARDAYGEARRRTTAATAALAGQAPAAPRRRQRAGAAVLAAAAGIAAGVLAAVGAARLAKRVPEKVSARASATAARVRGDKVEALLATKRAHADEADAPARADIFNDF
jgi:hypothetical protein